MALPANKAQSALETGTVSGASRLSLPDTTPVALVRRDWAKRILALIFGALALFVLVGGSSLECFALLGIGYAPNTDPALLYEGIGYGTLFLWLPALAVGCIVASIALILADESWAIGIVLLICFFAGSCGVGIVFSPIDLPVHGPLVMFVAVLFLAFNTTILYGAWRLVIRRRHSTRIG